VLEKKQGRNGEEMGKKWGRNGEMDRIDIDRDGQPNATTNIRVGFSKL